jgi:hypothetical protein
MSQTTSATDFRERRVYKIIDDNFLSAFEEKRQVLYSTEFPVSAPRAAHEEGYDLCVWLTKEHALDFLRTDCFEWHQVWRVRATNVRPADRQMRGNIPFPWGTHFADTVQLEKRIK